MEFTSDEIKHIAQLAKIEVSNTEAVAYSQQFSGILEYFKILDEVDVSDITETSQVNGLTTITRPDEVHPMSDNDALLECSVFETEKHSIKIPKVI